MGSVLVLRGQALLLHFFPLNLLKEPSDLRQGGCFLATTVVIHKHMGLQSRRFSSEATQGRSWSKKGNVLIWLSLPLFCLELLYFWPLGVSDVLCWQ